MGSMIYLQNFIYIASLILVIFAATGVLNFIHGDNYLTKPDIDANNVQTIDPNHDVKILNNQMFTESEIPVVIGQAQNTGHYHMKYISITVNFYDRNGKLLYSSFDAESYVAPDEIWNFKVPYRKSGTPYSYKVEVGPTM